MSTFRAGNGAPWLDLLSQLSGRYLPRQVDAIAEPSALRAWLREYGQEPTGPIGPAEVERFQLVREALHRTAAAAVRGEGAAPGDVRLLARALEADLPLRIGSADDRLTVARPVTAAEALARLVRDAVQDLSGPRRAQLRACGDETCSGIFLDHTGRRRWCSDERCGNRVRVRAHRARTRQA